MPMLLGELKVALDVQDYSGETALHDAARFGHAAVVEALLAAGASKSLKNNDGQTAAEVAVAYGKTAVAEMLA